MTFDLNFYKVHIHSNEYLLEEKGDVFNLVIFIFGQAELTTIKKILNFMLQSIAIVSIMPNSLVELVEYVDIKIGWQRVWQ